MNNNRLWGFFRGTFARGVALTVPVVITIWVLRMLFNAIDGIISPIFDQILERHIPGLGFISMIVLILIVGGLSRILIGRVIVRGFERVLVSIPIARTIYGSIKDLLKAFQMSGKGSSFKQVVLIEYPRAGSYTIGFATNVITITHNGKQDSMVSVYLPNPPNPTSGIMILVPREEVSVLNLSVEEGIKLVFSGGIVSPPSLSTK